MAKRKLTVKFVDNVKTDKKRQEFCDTLLVGFGLRVMKSGAKSYYVRYPMNGRPKRETLGNANVLTLSKARDMARCVLEKVADSTIHDVGKITIKNSYDEFIEKYAKVRNRDWRGAKGVLKPFIKEFGNKHICELTRRDIIQHLDKALSRGITAQANRILAYISSYCSWCVDRCYIEVNPCIGIKKPAPEIKRNRVLSEGELRNVLGASKSMPYPFGPLFMVLALTGQRRSEVSNMKWSEIDFDKKMWTLPKERCKNKMEHRVPLTDTVINILQKIPRLLHCEYVFTTTGRTPVSGHSKVKRRLNELSGVHDDWRLHDIRRTVGTGMASLGIPPYVIEKVSNRKSGTFAGVVGVYNHYSYDKEKREALEKWAQYVLSLMHEN